MDQSFGAGDEADVLDGEHEPSVYRVRVNMKHLFRDPRAAVLMCVSPRRRVRWLERRLRALFPLPPRVLLLSAGHLLPPSEPLAVLARDDTVEVLPAHDSDFETPLYVRSAAAPEGDNELEKSKQRALSQLDRLYGPIARPPQQEEHGVRPKRRRLRRRRRPGVDAERELDTPREADPEPEPEPEPEHEPEPEPESIVKDEVAPSVVRNGYRCSRAPRIVVPLKDF